MTNADKIRALRNETLARVITDCCAYVHYIDAGCSLCPIAHICDGDFICDKKAEPVLVLEDWEPTEDFMWCDRKAAPRNEAIK